MHTHRAISQQRNKQVRLSTTYLQLGPCVAFRVVVARNQRLDGISADQEIARYFHSYDIISVTENLRMQGSHVRKENIANLPRHEW